MIDNDRYIRMGYSWDMKMAMEREREACNQMDIAQLDSCGSAQCPTILLLFWHLTHGPVSVSPGKHVAQYDNMIHFLRSTLEVWGCARWAIWSCKMSCPWWWNHDFVVIFRVCFSDLFLTIQWLGGSGSEPWAFYDFWSGSELLKGSQPDDDTDVWGTAYNFVLYTIFIHPWDYSNWPARFGGWGSGWW